MVLGDLFFPLRTLYYKCFSDYLVSFLATSRHWRRKWQPTPVFLPEESQGWGSLVGCRLWGHTESDTTEVTQQQQAVPRKTRYAHMNGFLQKHISIKMTFKSNLNFKGLLKSSSQPNKINAFSEEITYYISQTTDLKKTKPKN